MVGSVLCELKGWGRGRWLVAPEMAYPVPTKGFSWPSPGTAMLFSPLWFVKCALDDKGPVTKQDIPCETPGIK